MRAIEQLRATIADLVPAGNPDRGVVMAATVTVLFADLIKRLSPDSPLVERVNRELNAVGLELVRTARH